MILQFPSKSKIETIKKGKKLLTEFLKLYMAIKITYDKTNF